MQSIYPKKKLKRTRSFALKMPVIDATSLHSLDDNIEFSVEEIVRYPFPGYCGPPSTSISFSPDGSLITYLFSSDGSMNRKVYAFDLKTREEELFFGPSDGGVDESNISEEEKLRRERARERGLGVTRYEWVMNSERKTIMVPLPTGIYLQDLSCPEPELKISSSSSSPIIDPLLSPDGTMVAYVRDYELHVFNILNDEMKQLTFGAKGNTLTHGLAEFVAQEEMDRRHGYWWSLDSKFIAFTEVDTTEIPLYRIMHQGKSSVGPDAQEDHTYPFAGAANVKVRLGVVSSFGSPVTWMNLLCGGNISKNEDEYLARVNWMHGNILAVQVLNRTHTKLKLLKFDITTGEGKVILTEEQDKWVTLNDCFASLDKAGTVYSGGFIWGSEKTGFTHLYLHDANGFCLGPITEGDWMVERVKGVNEDLGVVYFTGTLSGPLESNLYSTQFFPTRSHDVRVPDPTRLTHGKGRHFVILDHQLKNFVDVHDSLEFPPRISLWSLCEEKLLIRPVFETPFGFSRSEKLQLEPPVLKKIKADDGTTLYGLMYKPDASRFGPPPYKTLVSVYGGPCVQSVADTWANTVDMRAQYLQSKGILVWKLDNRGTARRGLKFEGSIKHNFGHIDANDQLTGAEWLIKNGLAKPDRIGLYGWSYGGYLSAMCLARFPDTFRCAISGAPVTSWDGYDTFYTEKYMGLPSENPEAYESSSIMHHVENIKGKLLLVHGMMDDNVHFRHTARLLNALSAAGKHYDLLVFPNERHMPRMPKDRLYMEKRVWEFIENNL